MVKDEKIKGADNKASEENVNKKKKEKSKALKWIDKKYEMLKGQYRKACHWWDHNFGPDRLTLEPRKDDNDLFNDPLITSKIHHLRKLYLKAKTKNIAITGVAGAGKTSFIKRFEDMRFFKIGKFLCVDFNTFSYENDNDPYPLDAALDKAILDSIKFRGNTQIGRGKEKIIINILTCGFALCMLYLVFKNNLWIESLLADRSLQTIWTPLEVRITIVLIVIVLAIFLFRSIAKSVVKLFHSLMSSRFNFKLTAKNASIEAFTEDESLYRGPCRIVDELSRIRWQIGRTVVFDNLESLGGDNVFSSAINHFLDLNKKTNDHLQFFKNWDVSCIRRPIRFIYIYQNDKVQLRQKLASSLESIEIPTAVSADIVFTQLKSLFEIEVSKGADFPINILFPVDVHYESNVSKYLVNRKVMNKIVKECIHLYEDCASRLRPEKPLKSDIHRMFSFVVYGQFFSKDRAKFARKESVVFTNSRAGEDIDSKYLELFEYLVSGECPEEYRINFLCLRFFGTHPEWKDKNASDYNKALRKWERKKLSEYEKALKKDNLSLAQDIIERLICCHPNKKKYYAMRSEVIERKNDSQTHEYGWTRF